MATKEEVERFLTSFRQKMKVYSIVFRDDRNKNLSTLALLDIPPSARVKVVESITVEDYNEGPILDTLYKMGEMWVFGKDVYGHEVYIKISLGYPNSSTICISFHVAEYPMHYPFKENKNSK